MASDTTLAWPEDGTLTHSSGQGPQGLHGNREWFLVGCAELAVRSGHRHGKFVRWDPRVATMGR